MIYNTTYTNKDDLKEINEIVGKPFSLLNKIKLGGIGSKRWIIQGVAAQMNALIEGITEINYANIELRPNGIIVHITKQLDRYCWAIPYHKIVLFNSSFFSIHADGNYIRFAKNINFQESKNFIRKMIAQKDKHQQQFNVYE